MSIDKPAILAELERLQHLRFRKNQNRDVSESDEASYEYMLSFFATVLEENEDILYGLFWDEYNKLLIRPKPDRRSPQNEKDFIKSWYMDLFEGIAQKATPRSVRFAGSLLLDPHYPLRDFVAERLGEMGSPDAYKYLVSVVLDEEDWQIASRAARSLGEIGAVQAEPILVNIIIGNTHTSLVDYERKIIRDYALNGLYLLNTPSAHDAMIKIALRKDLDAELRTDVLQMLFLKYKAEIQSLLQQLSSDEDKEVQELAIYYLEQLDSAI